MKTREEALEYGLSFPDTYTEMPFHDPGWQLVRVKGSKKAFLWTYEKDGVLHLNVKPILPGGTSGAAPFLPSFPHIIRIKNTGTRLS